MFSVNILSAVTCFLLLSLMALETATSPGIFDVWGVYEESATSAQSSMEVAQEVTTETTLETLNSTWDEIEESATSVQSSMAVTEEVTTETSLETLNSTWGEIKESATSVQVSEENGQLSNFRIAFVGYEKRIKSFVENVRRGYMSVSTDANSFLAELRGYMEQLPKNETKIAMKKHRSRCYCEGMTHSPCPDRCIDSCYAYDPYDLSFDNCTKEWETLQMFECRCYDGSPTSCSYGLHECYDVEIPAVVAGDEKPCLGFAVDQSMVEESFLRFSDLLLEPLKILVRDLEFQVSSFKQAIIASELLSSITSHLCEGQDPGCFPEATELLGQKLGMFKQRKRNITLEMIKTQEQAELTSKNVHTLKEQTFAQISQSIRKYTCCLRSFNFTVQDNDCNPKPIEIRTTTMSTPVIPPLPYSRKKNQLCSTPNFLCENERCIFGSYRCDGNDDCGDMSDEVNCENPNTEYD